MLKKLSIRDRFIATSFFVLALLVSFMIFLIVMINQLAELPLKIVDHPLKVSNAAYYANVEVMRMQNNLKDILLSEENYELSVLLDKINTSEERVYDALEIIEDNILGVEGRVLQRDAKRLFEGWKPIRVEIIEFVKSGNKDLAINVLKSKDEDHTANLERKLVELNRYARTKASTFQEEVLTLEDRLKFWSIVGIIFVIISVFISIVRIGRSVLLSIGSLSKQLKVNIESKDMQKVYLEGNDELVQLSEIFNDLVLSLNNQLWVKEGNKRLFTILNNSGKSEKILTDYLREMSVYSDFVSAAYYHLIDGNLSLLSVYNRLEFMENEFKLGKGIVGESVQNNTSYTIDYSKKSSILREHFPFNFISTKPIASEKKVYGVLVIATMDNLTKIENEYLDLALKDIKTHLENLEQRKQIDSLLEESIKTNQELVIRQEELEKINKYKNQFFANVSHELKTPLNSIIILSNILNSKKVSNLEDADNEKIEVINNAASELLNIINNILDLSRIESGKTVRNEEIFSVRKFMDKLENIYSPMISEKGLVCNFHYDEDSTLFGDQEKIYHIVSNLISNSVKFTVRGEIEVKFIIDTDDYPIKFQVRDTGIGIAKDKQEIIFDEFIQSDGSISRTYGGSGLGLAICKSYASILDGKIELESELGKGSIFTLKLPDYYLVNKNNVGEFIFSEEEEEIDTDNLSSYKGKNVLVCDDEPFNLFAIASVLEDFGIEPQTVSDVYSGIKLMKNKGFDAIFMDLMMPEVDGFTSLEIIKDEYGEFKKPIVIVTAAELSDEDLNRIAVNDYYLLKKPITQKAILELFEIIFPE